MFVDRLTPHVSSSDGSNTVLGTEMRHTIPMLLSVCITAIIVCTCLSIRLQLRHLGCQSTTVLVYRPAAIALKTLKIN